MTWIAYSLLVPFFAAFNNVVDQILTRRYFPEDGEIALFLGGITYLFVLPPLAVIFHEHLAVTPGMAMALIAIGLLSPFIWFPYFLALETDDTSMAMPIFQTSPIFTFLLAWLLLGETVSTTSLLGAATIIIASIAVSFDWSIKKLRGKTAALMILCAALYAVQTFVFRLVAGDLNFLVASFWVAVGFVITDIGMLFYKKDYMEKAWKSVTDTKGFILVPTSLQEFSYFATIIFTIKALELAPATGLFSSVLGIQPAFVLLMSWLAGFFCADCFHHHKPDKIFAWRLACALVMFTGLYILHTNTV